MLSAAGQPIGAITLANKLASQPAPELPGGAGRVVTAAVGRRVFCKGAKGERRGLYQVRVSLGIGLGLG